MKIFSPNLLLSGILLWPAAARCDVWKLYCDRKIPQAAFAADEIRRAAAGKSISIDEKSLADLAQAQAEDRIVIASGTEARRIAGALGGMAPPAASQSYALRRRAEGRRNTYAALAADEDGAMYGGLDIAEAIRLGTLARMADTVHTPYIARRGIKFNIPLDARTPSYSDAGDSAQQNIPEMWSMDFWREFLDEMARDRYNVLSLWSLNPFPSLVKVPEYPGVALDDVKRTTVRFEDHRHNGTDMANAEILGHLETVKRISIDDKIRFWREVMQYAHDRGIEVFIFTWNIFAFGEQGKYGITSDPANKTTIDYFRKSVRQTILTYPLLAGIGITAGENMPKINDDEKEKWLWQTYGEGITDAMKQQPGRKFRLIHRQHQTQLSAIQEVWKSLPATFDMSYKYSVAHMYSTPKPPFAQKDILGELPPNLHLWMTVRNDDIYSFRWGDPVYARAYIHNMPGPDKMTGFYMGPDGYTWGREFVSTEPDKPRELVIKKQWYSFVLWGRLSFEPSLPDNLFERMLAVRFPEAPATKLFEASSYASRVIPRVTTFSWGDIDIKWFPEACSGAPNNRGFYTVERFMKGESMPGGGVMTIADYLKMLDGQHVEGMTPLQVAAELHTNAARALQLVAEMRPVQAKELRFTLGDYEAMAQLGEYYSEKILGATDLALFDRTGEAGHKDSAVKHLQAALEHWKKYAAVATAQYKPQLLTRVGYFDLNQLTSKVQEDVAIAQRWQHW